jgi:hypothetical protein
LKNNASKTAASIRYLVCSSILGPNIALIDSLLLSTRSTIYCKSRVCPYYTTQQWCKC